MAAWHTTHCSSALTHRQATFTNTQARAGQSFLPLSPVTSAWHPARPLDSGCCTGDRTPRAAGSTRALQGWRGRRVAAVLGEGQQAAGTAPRPAPRADSAPCEQTVRQQNQSKGSSSLCPEERATHIHQHYTTTIIGLSHRKTLLSCLV